MSMKGTFMMNCRSFFGNKEGQSNIDFAKELRQLSDKDKAEIQAGMEKLGYEFVTVESAGKVKDLHQPEKQQGTEKVKDVS